MIWDLNDLDDGLTLNADLCVVGAGAAGLLLARALMSCGLKIVIVESGGKAVEADVQRLSGGESATDLFRGLEAGRSRAFGGTTVLWGGQCIRLDPIDFQFRPWVPESGWPVSADDLAPYYAQAESTLEMSPEDIAMPAWERFGLDPLAFNPARLRALHGIFIRRPNLGMRFWAELRKAKSVDVWLHATAQRLSTDASGTNIDGVEIVSLSGKRAEVKARRVVLCAGAIENARLLLLSDEADPRGLGNASDHVGRYLQDHPCGRVATIKTTSPRALQNHYNMLYGKRIRYLPKIALAEATQRSEGLLNCVGRLAYDYDEDSGTRVMLDILAELRAGHFPKSLASRIGHIGAGLPEIADSLWRVMAKGLSPAPRPRAIHLEAFSEQTPEAGNRVMLGDTRDVFGQRQVRIEWRLDSLTMRTLRGFTRVVAEEFARLGLGEIRPTTWLHSDTVTVSDIMDSYHPAGTTRMASHAGRGVVDTDCQVFGVNGLYAVGSSVFPTSGAANPTLTIAALTLRLADLLRSTFLGERMVRQASNAPPLNLALLA